MLNHKNLFGESFKSAINAKLAEKSLLCISQKGQLLARDTFKEEEDKSADAVQGTIDDPTLDPEMEKEFFHSSFEEGDTLISAASMGASDGSS